MNQGVQTIIYPVNDIAKAKAMFRAFLGVEPYADKTSVSIHTVTSTG